MNSRDFNTPKFDEFLNFLTSKVEEGHIKEETLTGIQTRLADAVEELGNISMSLVKKQTNKVGWITFTIGWIIGMSVSTLVYFVF